MNQNSKSEPGLDIYVRNIRRHPLLSRADETQLAERYRRGDEGAGQALVRANLRFVVKVAHDYGGYGLKMLDLVQEGNVGLIMAVRKFEPDRGFRLVSYAVWWIRAYMQSYIMRSWSQVKLGTTQAQRKLFFKLRGAREAADRRAAPGQTAAVEEVARSLGVKAHEVTEMEQRMVGGDLSLDTPIVTDSGHASHVDVLMDPASDRLAQSDTLARRELNRQVGQQVAQLMRVLNAKERYIVERRLMSDSPATLQEIGQHFSISRERARQIEGAVRGKMRVALGQAGLSPQAA